MTSLAPPELLLLRLLMQMELFERCAT